MPKKGRVGATFLAVCLLMAGCWGMGEGKPTRPAEKPLAKAPQSQQVNQVKQQLQAKSVKQSPTNAQPQGPMAEKQSLSPQEQKELEKEVQKRGIFFYGPKTRKWVALTFDDGPDDYYTLQILDILKRERVTATFFVLGNHAQKYPDVLRMIVANGHVIGNHSYNHPEFTKISAGQVNWQLDQTNAIIYAAIHKRPLLFRPPFGAINKPLIQQISSKGFKVVEWNVDTQDWKGPSPQKIIYTVQRELRPGSIILQHCAGGPQLKESVEALPMIIHYLKKNGYHFVTVDQLLGVPAYAE
jgi:polysaccharide deacetylase family sporulation protein PdaB